LARVHQIQENEKGYDAAVAEAMAIANEVPGRYRFLELYVDLVSAAGPGRNPIEAERSLKHAEESSGLAIDYLTLEYGHLWLCRGELARARIGRRDQANSAFAKAFAAYVATGCPWGILRAWIGLQLGGSRREVPLNPELLEGTDRRLWQAFQTVGNVRLGQLSMNLP
jgi:hypothetical protein